MKSFRYVALLTLIAGLRVSGGAWASNDDCEDLLFLYPNQSGIDRALTSLKSIEKLREPLDKVDSLVRLLPVLVPIPYSHDPVVTLIGSEDSGKREFFDALVENGNTQLAGSIGSDQGRNLRIGLPKYAHAPLDLELLKKRLGETVMSGPTSVFRHTTGKNLIVDIGAMPDSHLQEVIVKSDIPILFVGEDDAGRYRDIFAKTFKKKVILVLKQNQVEGEDWASRFKSGSFFAQEKSAADRIAATIFGADWEKNGNVMATFTFWKQDEVTPDGGLIVVPLSNNTKQLWPEDMQQQMEADSRFTPKAFSRLSMPPYEVQFLAYNDGLDRLAEVVRDAMKDDIKQVLAIDMYSIALEMAKNHAPLVGGVQDLPVGATEWKELLRPGYFQHRRQKWVEWAARPWQMLKPIWRWLRGGTKTYNSGEDEIGRPAFAYFSGELRKIRSGAWTFDGSDTSLAAQAFRHRMEQYERADAGYVSGRLPPIEVLPPETVKILDAWQEASDELVKSGTIRDEIWRTADYNMRKEGLLEPIKEAGVIGSPSLLLIAAMALPGPLFVDGPLKATAFLGVGGVIASAWAVSLRGQRRQAAATRARLDRLNEIFRQAQTQTIKTEIEQRFHRFFMELDDSPADLHNRVGLAQRSFSLIAWTVISDYLGVGMPPLIASRFARRLSADSIIHR
jgi:hypothetical protein